jgi:superfamily II DNA or RNA helicase
VTLPLFDVEPLMDVKPPSLRDYQAACIKNLRALVVAGKRRILVVGPTGMGKMVVLAAIIKTSTLPVVFVCHRMELIDGCALQLRKLGITNIGVMRGDDDRVNPSASIQLCSIATLARRDKPFAGKKVLVLVDEAHRSASDSYRDHVFSGPWESGSIFLGFTATATRLDGKPLGDLYEELLVAASYHDLLKKPDWLVAPDCFSTPLQPDLDGVRVAGGDFEEGALGEVMNRKELVGRVVEHWLKLAHLHPVFLPSNGMRVPAKFTEGERRRTFCFATTIAHSLAICDEFARADVRVAHLDGTTPENERRAMLRDLASGELEVICNCNVLLEGVDVPQAKCVTHARPTMSLVLWMQSTGRIMRPWSGIIPLLLDHAGNYDRHGPPHEDRIWHLDKKPDRAKGSVRGKLCKACFAYCSPGAYICPYCGFEFPPPLPSENPQQTETALALRDATPEAARRELYEKMVLLARKRGYKPGFASAKYKEKFGEWPPWAWSEATKASFASDQQWQSNLARREAWKKKEDEKSPVDAAPAPEIVAAPPEAPKDQDGEVYPPKPVVENDPWALREEEDSLSSWLDEMGIR